MEEKWVPRREAKQANLIVRRAWNKFNLPGIKEVLHRGFANETAIIRDGDKDLVVIWDVSSERIYKEVTGDKSEAVSYSYTSDVSMQTEAGSKDGAVSNIASNLTLENIGPELEGSKFLWRGYHA